MILTTYFKLVRWKNLLLIIYLFIVLKFLLFKSLNVETNLSIYQFVILLFSILFITAGGYIINDIYDVKADLVNKPTKVIVSQKITKETAQQWYKITNATGLILGIGLCIHLEKPTASFLFLSAALLLYFYAKKLKSLALIGNIIVSALIGLSIFLLPFFEFNFLNKNENQSLALNVILVLFIFAFSLNLIREIVKDIEDVNGDYQLNMNTLPILIGRTRTKYIASVLCLIPLSLGMFILMNYTETYRITILYFLFSTFIPLLYVMLKLRSIKKKNEFHIISTQLKIIMFLGINSLLILSIFQQ